LSGSPAAAVDPPRTPQPVGPTGHPVCKQCLSRAA
jgi:hypothetical protein